MYGDFMNKIEFFNYLPDDAKDIRIKVFVDEQGFENELDDIDNTAIHILIYLNGAAAGTARMFTEDNGKSYHIGRVAILPQFRKNHLGAEIVTAICDKAKALGAEKCELSAQCRVKDFYKSLGFEESGEEYLDEYCPHIHMEKTLQ